ncbi:MAG: ribosome maturation factor RimP [Methylophilaceae bacterium]|nr:ribosome maturation factor RimP [Methylophilaceae bacterium]
MQDLYSLLERSLTQLGYELVDVDVSARGKLIRLFIDKPTGITIDDCVLVSNQIGNLLTVENDIDYDRLEVSSPGLDRVLKKEADFVRFAGERVQIKLRIPVDGRKNYVGILRSYENGQLLIECDALVHEIALENIDKARLSPEF